MASNEERLYTERVSEQLQYIQHDGLIAAPAAYVLLRRLECVLNNETVPEHLSSYVITGDGIAEHPDGRFKYVFDCFADGTWKQRGKFIGGEFVLQQGAYEQLQGVEFSRDEQELAGMLNRDFPSVEEAARSMVWRVAGRDAEQILSPVLPWDARLVQEYGARLAFSHITNAMGVYLSDMPEKPRLRASFVGRLEGWSRFYGGCNLDGGGWRVVGVAPETLESARRRSYDVCGRSTKREYPALAGEKAASTERGVGEGVKLAETNKKKAPVEVTSKSGFLPGREHDIEVAGTGRQIDEYELTRACEIALQSGHKNPEKVIEVLQLQMGLKKDEGKA